MLELALIAPTFNERGNIEEFVRRLEMVLVGMAWEVVFVDDDSPDGTAEAVRALAQTKPHVRLLHRIGRRGLARAVIEGALSTTAPIVGVMDADLQHDETVLPSMLRKLADEKLDLVVASRYLDGGSVDGWDPRRLRLSRWATRLANTVVQAELTDPMSGFFVMRREAFDAAVRRLSGEGYKILLDLVASTSAPLRIGEVAYAFKPRQSGESKLDSAVLWEFALLLLDKYLGRWVPARFVLFSLVGASGVIVHFLALWAALRVVRLPFEWSQALATLIAMTTNYALNNAFTYRDRRHHGLGWLRGLLTFYAVCGLGVAANVGVATALFEREGWVLAAAAGALVGVVWNYVASAFVTWRRR
jgi:dolichol-phosphate mannosyltransferase